jgi:hypothetical protein
MIVVATTTFVTLERSGTGTNILLTAAAAAKASYFITFSANSPDRRWEGEKPYKSLKIRRPHSS